MKKAFTLIEVMIVIAVIAILAGITTVGWGNYRQGIEEKKVKSDLQMVVSALQNEINFKDSYPNSLPSTIKPSDGVELEYTREGSNYCILAKSIKDPSIRYYIRSTNSATIQSGNCTPPPAAPVVAAEALSSTSIRVSWSPANGATSYIVRYGTASPTTTIGCNTSPCTISTLNSSTTYRFNVTASNSSGSTTSSTVTAATPAPYTCPEGGTLSGSTCTETYDASYQSGSDGYYYCPNGGSRSGTTCYTSGSYPASSNTTYSCSGSYVVRSGSSCYYHEASPDVNGQCPPYGPYKIGGQCYSYYGPASESTTYSCPSGGSLSGTTCYTSSSYSASYEPATSGYHYCSRGGSRSGTTCTRTYAATQG